MAVLSKNGVPVKAMRGRWLALNAAPGMGRITDLQLDQGGSIVLAGDDDTRASKSPSSKLAIARLVLD